VPAGSGNGSRVGITASATDPNSLPLTYSLDDSADGRFAIDPGTGIVTVANASLIDASGTGPAYRITVRASNCTNSNTAMFTIAAPPGPFAYDATTHVLTIIATGTQDSFTFSQATAVDSSGVLHATYTFNLDGITKSYADTQLAYVLVHSASGHGTAVLNTNDAYVGSDGKTHPTAEAVTLGPTGEVQKIDAAGHSYGLLFVSGFDHAYAYLGAIDSGVLLDTAGVANTLVTTPSYSYLNSGNAYYLINGGAYLYGYAANPSDVVYQYAGTGPSTFVASGKEYSFMTGIDVNRTFYNQAVGFAFNYGQATHPGQDTAYLYDSPLDDVFSGDTHQSYLYADNADGSLAYFDQASYFTQVYANSSAGGIDYAYVYDAMVNHTIGFRRIV
jgi:hypothetical protein